MQQLSKKEYKYRCKIIAENHLDKQYQQLIDKMHLIMSYKDMYNTPELIRNIVIEMKMIQMAQSVYLSEISAEKAADAFNKMIVRLKG